MLKHSFIMVLLVLPICLQAQTALEKNRDFNDRFYITLGYNQSDFLNPRFSEARKEDEMKRQFGYIAGVKFIRLPFLFDAHFFSSSFSSTELPDDLFGEETKVSHRGAEIAASFSLIQSLKNFIPYAGIGYQSASLRTPYITDDNDKEIKEESSLDVSSPIFKTGILWKPNPFFGLEGEYKRSLKLKNNLTAYNQLTVAIIFNLSQIYGK